MARLSKRMLRHNSGLYFNAVSAFDELAHKYDNIDVSLRWSTRSKHCFARMLSDENGGKYEIVLSPLALRWEKRYGSLEWPRISKKILKGIDLRSIKGDVTASWTIAHEFAHVLQHEWQRENSPKADRYGSISGSVHNNCFIWFFKKTVLALELAESHELIIVDMEYERNKWR